MERDEDNFATSLLKKPGMFDNLGEKKDRAYQRVTDTFSPMIDAAEKVSAASSGISHFRSAFST